MHSIFYSYSIYLQRSSAGALNAHRAEVSIYTYIYSIEFASLAGKIASMSLPCRRRILGDFLGCFPLARPSSLGASVSDGTVYSVMSRIFSNSKESLLPEAALVRRVSSVSNRQQEAGRSDSSARSETIEEVRARIFGHHIGDGLRSGRKILAKPLIGDQVASYYPEDWFAGDPLLLDVEAERYESRALWHGLGYCFHGDTIAMTPWHPYCAGQSINWIVSRGEGKRLPKKVLESVLGRTNDQENALYIIN